MNFHNTQGFNFHIGTPPGGWVALGGGGGGEGLYGSSDRGNPKVQEKNVFLKLKLVAYETVRFIARNGEFGYVGLNFVGSERKHSQNQKILLSKIGSENEPPKVSMKCGIDTLPLLLDLPTEHRLVEEVNLFGWDYFCGMSKETFQPSLDEIGA